MEQDKNFHGNINKLLIEIEICLCYSIGDTYYNFHIFYLFYMMTELVKAGTSDALVINSISKRSFDSDVEIGAPRKGGPPGYMSVQFHTKMAKLNHLYKLSVDGLIIGAAILFIDGDKLNIGRIFISPDYHRKGYGIYMMQEIEKMFPAVKEIYLDTPVWNIRTNSFYPKQGYIEYKRDSEFVYYTKTL